MAARFSNQFLGIAAGDVIVSRRGSYVVEWAKYLGATDMKVFPEGGAMVVKYIGVERPELFPALASLAEHSMQNMSR